MKITILSAIAWRTPPRKYGPWGAGGVQYPGRACNERNGCYFVCRVIVTAANLPPAAIQAMQQTEKYFFHCR